MISIIIPTYSERSNIEPLIGKLDATIKEKHEIIVVDDNSPDGTSSLVQKLMGSRSNLKLVRRPGKSGLSSAITSGLGVAKGDIIAVMDADLSHPPGLIPELVSHLDANDIVVGSRLIAGGGVENWPFRRKIISMVAESLARAVLGVRTTDPLSGFFAIRRGLLQNTRIRTKGYKILLNILHDNKGARVKEIPYTFKDRVAGKTKLGLNEFVSFILDLVRIRLG